MEILTKDYKDPYETTRVTESKAGCLRGSYALKLKTYP